MHPKIYSTLVVLACLAISALPARASIGFVVGEPFGSFGTMLPVGHASIYFDHICMASPVKVRLCAPGEQGVVVSRYHDLRSTQLDWMAYPAETFFYGMAEPELLPDEITPSYEAELRERYRQTHLLAEVPTPTDRRQRRHLLEGDWAEGIGATFDRRVFVYLLDSTPAQDAAIVEWLNASPNRRRYTLGRHNCADFAVSLLNTLLPEPIIRSRWADFDFTTPKRVARLLDRLPQTHPELHPRVMVLPQRAGTLRRSRPIRGSAELLVMQKRYAATLAVIQPEILLTSALIFVSAGHWSVGSDATPMQPGEWPQPSRSTDSNTASAEGMGLLAK